MTSARSIRVVIADDQPLARHGFGALIGAEDGMEVVGEAATGGAAVDLAHAKRPDVVLMDVRMPGMDGIEATRRICSDARLEHVRVLILTTFDLDQYVHEGLRAGASGFLLKDSSPGQLLDAIRAVASGEALVAPSVTRRLIDAYTAQPAPDADQRALAVLTEREREVLAEIGKGHNNDEIAQQLLISPLTAKTHVSRILNKLGARDRVQLVVIAYETGLARPGDGSSGFDAEED